LAQELSTQLRIVEREPHTCGGERVRPAAPSAGTYVPRVSIMRFAMTVAVYVVLVDDGRLLLMRRAGSGYRDGQLSLPAGHLDGGEDAVSGLVRELEEELGVVADPTSCRLALTMHRAPERAGDREYVDLFFTVNRWRGAPVIAEPGKCEELVWVDRQHLPLDVVDHVAAALRFIDAGQPLLLHGWRP
jgi:8-oxo-dGTP diphosphatase